MKQAGYDALIRVTQATEWVLEPCNADGDILDPMHYDGQREAVAEVPGQWRHFPEATYMDLAKRVRRGSEAEGVDTDVYTYWRRYYPDGTSVELDRRETPNF